MSVTERTPLIFLSAGESSGDHYGAEIIQALRAEHPELRFTGLGGLAMECAGQHRIVRAEDVAVMGITEILRHVPRIYARYRRLIRAMRRERPDVAVLIDFPDVNFRLARELKRHGVPVIWFASPQLWAWKRRRLRWVQQRVDRMLVLFPFEERFYRARGVLAEFVGHPLVKSADAVADSSSREVYAAAHRLDPSCRWVALLPGSRQREVEANLPAMLAAAALLAHRLPGRLQFILPLASGLDPAHVAQLCRTGASPEAPKVTLVDDAAAALRYARVAAIASGTATVLAAVMGTPFLVVYRVSRLTFALAKRLVRYPPEIGAAPDADGTPPVAMVNLIAGRRVVPELLNQRFTAETVADAVADLLDDGPSRAAQIADLAEVRRSLDRQPGAEFGVLNGTARVAEIVVEMLNARDLQHVRTEHPRV